MTVLYPNQVLPVRLAGTGFSLATSVTYFIVAFGIVPEGFKSPPMPVMVVAALAYLVGGTLIMRVRRRLLRLGAVLNLLVVIAFVMAVFTGNATVDALSLTGKAAQVGLEVMLLSALRQEVAER